MSMIVEMILRLVDQATGPARNVENAVAGIQKAAEKLNATPATGGVKASVWFEQQKALEKAREEAERYEKTIARVNAAQSAAMTAAAARGIERASSAMWRAGVKAGVAGEHSQVSLETQGNTTAQIEAIQREAADLSRRYRAFSKTQVETMLGDAQTFVGSLHDATELMPDLLRLRSIQQGMHGHSDDKEFSYLVKALEQAGVAGDPERARTRLDTFARWMEVYRETFRVNDINEFYRGLKGPIARSLSENFLRGTAGHFIQELGGHATGNALTQLYMAVVAGRAQPRALAAFHELGLLDMDKVVEGGPAGIRFAEPGAIKGWKLFTTDPDKWITDILGPALAKLSGEKREELEGALFSDQTARNIADKILHQQAIIAKDRGFIDRAPGLEAWKIWAEKDPSMAATAASSQFQNLMRDAGKPYMPAATKFLNWLSELEAKLGGLAEQHPAATAAAGLGAVFAGWSAAAALARAALIKGGEAWGEGLARAAGEAPKQPGFLKQFLFGGGKAGGLGSSVGHGIVSGLLYAAGQWAIGAIEEKVGWTSDKKAAAEAEIDRRAHSWWRSHGVDLPWWEPERVAPLPSFLQTHIEDETRRRGRREMRFGLSRFNGPTAPMSIPGGATLPIFALDVVPGVGSPAPASPATPHVDTHEIDEARRKAQEAGEEIKQSLDVTAAPRVDAASIDAFLAKLREARSLMQQLNQMGGGLRRGGLGSHALHDGPEAH